MKCFMFNPARGGGGNLANRGPLIVRRSAAIGDALCATSVANRLMDLGHPVNFQVHPDIQAVLRRAPRLSDVSNPDGAVHVNLDGAYEQHPRRKHLHFHQMFFERAHQALQRIGVRLGDPTNCRPRLRLSPQEIAATQSNLEKHPRPWVMICPRSNSWACRTVPDAIWQQAAEHISGTKFWLGAHPAPPGIVDLKCTNLEHLMQLIGASDLYLGTETGPMHIAAALSIPCVVIKQATDPAMTLNDQNDFISVSTDLDCLHCQLNVCPKNQHQPPCQNVDPVRIAVMANERLKSRVKDGVSVVIPTFNAPADRLNKCIRHAIPQVDEIVVTCDGTGRIPDGVIMDSRVRYVKSNRQKLGFGKNVNQGVRHTHNAWILLLNDDVFLDDGAVNALKDAAKDANVGVVGHLLRYPSGQIQHGGKHRKPGMRGWGHTDHRGWENTHKNIIEAEVVTGASMLVRRKAFYDVGGFDEDFWMYAEDDAFCLSMLSHGWKVRFTPFATGIHEECQSSSKEGNVMGMSMLSNEIFWKKWGWWIEKNLYRVPGVFV